MHIFPCYKYAGTYGRNICSAMSMTCFDYALAAYFDKLIQAFKGHTFEFLFTVIIFA